MSYQDISYVLDFEYNGSVHVADNDHHIETYLHLKIYDENLAVVSATGRAKRSSKTHFLELMVFLFHMPFASMLIADNFILESLVADLAFGFLVVMDLVFVVLEETFILENFVAGLALGFLVVMDLASVHFEVYFILANLAADLTFGFLVVMD